MTKLLTRFLRVQGTRLVMGVFRLLPLKKNTMFFSAYEGKQYSCNPRAVFEAACRDPAFREFQFIWELNDREKRGLIDCPNVRFVEHNSLAYFRAVMTSKYLIVNSGLSCRFPLRRSQVNINTWHGGGAFKRVGNALKSDMSGDLYELEIAAKQTTWFLSSSRIFTDVMIDSVLIPRERFLPIGMPRNDLFFDKPRCRALRGKVLERYGLSQEDFLVLYAPTYRGAVGTDSWDASRLDMEALRQAVCRKFGRKAVILVRMHYFNPPKDQPGGAVSVSDYPDMQELLAAADMLVTDYSSSMWDFCLTGKPCLLYTPDLDSYDLERGFYSSPYTWPGLVCKTNEALCRAVAELDEAAYAQKLRDYLHDAGSYDQGTAAKSLLEILKK